jgi:hypothetical protein
MDEVRITEEDLAIVHPEPDTAPNEANGNEPPATWQPNGKARVEDSAPAEYHTE